VQNKASKQSPKMDGQPFSNLLFETLVKNNRLQDRKRRVIEFKCNNLRACCSTINKEFSLTIFSNDEIIDDFTIFTIKFDTYLMAPLLPENLSTFFSVFTSIVYGVIYPYKH
jgi:hypothetical protein